MNRNETVELKFQMSFGPKLAMAMVSTQLAVQYARCLVFFFVAASHSFIFGFIKYGVDVL